MLILSIDTAFDACSAAILDGEDILWTDQQIIGRGHGEALPPMIAGGLATAGVSARDLGRIGVVIGPGAFAGVRVGLAFARALRIGLTADIIGLSSNEGLAASMNEGPAMRAAVFDARRGQVYAALYDAALNECLAPFVANPADASLRIAAAVAGRALAVAGSGASLLTIDRPYTVDPVMHIDPVWLARRVSQKASTPHPPAPLYLRPPDAAPAAASLFAGLGRP